LWTALNQGKNFVCRNLALRSLIFRALAIVLLSSVFPGRAWAVDYHFLRLWEPREPERWGLGANIAGSGVVFISQAVTKDELWVRTRMYRPVDGGFDLFQEETAEIGAPYRAQPGTHQFLFNLRRNVQLQPGKYLVVAECFDVADEKPRLLASESVFLTAVVVGANKAAANGQQLPPAREIPIPRRATRGFDMHFARISEPIDIERHAEAVETIGVRGFVFLPDLEAKEDLNVRVRLYRPVDGELDIAHEEIAKVDAGWPGHPGTYKFASDLKPTQPVKPGKYLVRVDCLNKRDSQPALWATASEFLTIAAGPE
jgi:hypothetical protein